MTHFLSCRGFPKMVDGFFFIKEAIFFSKALAIREFDLTTGDLHRNRHCSLLKFSNGLAVN